eukprot:6563424-Pyramimonas_sp.AAC.1
MHRRARQEWSRCRTRRLAGNWPAVVATSRTLCTPGLCWSSLDQRFPRRGRQLSDRREASSSLCRWCLRARGVDRRHGYGGKRAAGQQLRDVRRHSEVHIQSVWIIVSKLTRCNLHGCRVSRHIPAHYVTQTNDAAAHDTNFSSARDPSILRSGYHPFRACVVQIPEGPPQNAAARLLRASSPSQSYLSTVR